MEIQHGIVTKIYPTDCAYAKAIVDDRIMIIGPSAAAELEIREIILPESITEFGSYAFYNCEKLETINIPSGVKKIGERCFSGCKSLKEIVLPEGITSIGAGAFNGCENLEEIVFPKSLKAINYRTLADCKKLKKVVIPDSVGKIGWGTFSGCESLENVGIPDSVTDFGYQMFLNCHKLKNVKVSSSLAILPDETFMGCTSLENIDLPQSIVEVGNSAFNGCKNLKTLPKYVYTFGNSAFKNCRSLGNVTINERITSLPNSLFEGCIKLSNVTCKSVPIGERAFRSCISLEQVPFFVTSYNKFAFENCISLREASNVNGEVPEGTFRGCKRLKKVNGSTLISSIGSGAFSGCTSLESYECSEKLGLIPSSAFENCKKLTSIILSDRITTMGNRSLFGCVSLSQIKLPECLKKIGANALKHCDSVKNIYIPQSLEDIGVGAFSYMNSLEKIEVSPKNKKYSTFDNLTLIDCQCENLVQYAIGSKNKTYSILPFTWQIEEMGNRELIRQIRGITEYAFAGATYLEELTVDSSVEYLEKTAFLDANKLKKLNIKRLPPFSSQGFRVVDHKKSDYDGGDFSFENVYLEDGITSLEIDGFSGFKRLRKVRLPQNDSLTIKGQVFKNCTELSEIFIPSSVSFINKQAFSESTLLKFENGIEISCKDFEEMGKRNNTKVYTLKEGYLIERDGCVVAISNAELEHSCSNSNLIMGNPDLVINYIALLSLFDKDIKFLRNGIFMAAFSDPKTYIDFSLAEKNETERESYQLVEPFKIEQHTPTKPTKVFENIESMIQSLLRNAIPVGARDCEIKNAIFGKNHIDLNASDAELFIKFFDANTKRMIELSDILNNLDTAVDNIKDLFKLAKVLGAFEDNAITRQNAWTFIIDRMLTNNTKDESSCYKIVGDDIHRKFNELKPRKDFDNEFAGFFMKNYKELCEYEKSHSGFICRVYNNFKEISKTSTSDKGSQRHLLVTFKKCCHYLATHKFDGVTKETEQLALLLGDWFDQDAAFQNGVTITNEAKSAPRNIFTKYEVGGNNVLLFDNSAKHDLKEPISEDFSFEWLPKQSLTNLLLGKYCNCCAHVNGAGAGIMRASMITSDHQNLVVRNNANEIIAKSTIYVNRVENYAVFNNIESSSRYTADNDKSKIYKAFMRGAKAFLKKYNENNPNQPLFMMTIGTSRNTVKQNFEANEKSHPISNILLVPKYGDWSLNGYGNYSGDSGAQQRIVLKGI